MSFAFVLTDDLDDRWFGTAGAAATRRGSTIAPTAPTVLTPGRVTFDHWLAAGQWFDFSTSGDLPAGWSTGAREARCDNCGATAASMCSLACPDRLLTSLGTPRLAVQVPCESHEGGGSRAGGGECPHCIDDLVTVAWATHEIGPLQVVDYRHRLRRSKPDQFKLSDGSFHDATPDIEPVCLPGRWAQGGSIEATS